MRTIKEVMDLSVMNLDLSVRCTNCMRNMNISNLSELTAKSKNEIASSRNVGKKSLEEIESKLCDIFWFFHGTCSFPFSTFCFHAIIHL